MERAEDEWGAGTIYYDESGCVLGSMQYGPGELFPRAAEDACTLSADAILVTCVPRRCLDAVGDAVAVPRRDRRGERSRREALEAFAFRYPEGESAYERFQVHKTIFHRDFLSDFGFVTVRSVGRVELARLELGGLQPSGGTPRARAASRARRVLPRARACAASVSR